MGGLISLLAGDHSKGVDIILNFEGNFWQSCRGRQVYHCIPKDDVSFLFLLLHAYTSTVPGAEPSSEEERQIHAAVAAVLNKGPQILDELSTYPGCEEYIRKACAFSTPFFLSANYSSSEWRCVNGI